MGARRDKTGTGEPQPAKFSDNNAIATTLAFTVAESVPEWENISAAPYFRVLQVHGRGKMGQGQVQEDKRHA